MLLKFKQGADSSLTLLLIEGLSINFDSNNFEALLRQLSNEEFQVVVTLPPARERELLSVDDSGQKALQRLDYLESWRLAIVGQ